MEPIKALRFRGDFCTPQASSDKVIGSLGLQMKETKCLIKYEAVVFSEPRLFAQNGELRSPPSHKRKK